MPHVSYIYSVEYVESFLHAKTYGRRSVSLCFKGLSRELLMRYEFPIYVSISQVISLAYSG
jgi:hypothetical protein